MLLEELEEEKHTTIHAIFGKDYIWALSLLDNSKLKLTPTAKHGGGAIMVWSCFATSQPGHLSEFITLTQVDIVGAKESAMGLDCEQSRCVFLHKYIHASLVIL